LSHARDADEKNRPPGVMTGAVPAYTLLRGAGSPPAPKTERGSCTSLYR